MAVIAGVDATAARQFDVVIVGGGPAGLSAALILGRCRRSVLVVDEGKPRNAASRGLHGYLTRDGVKPADLRSLGRAELIRYATVKVVTGAVMDIHRGADDFEVLTRGRQPVHATLLLLATGRVDPLPDKPGFAEFYGRGVYHCPYCDGWEHRDQPLAVWGADDKAADIALELRTWSHDVALLTNGPPEFGQASRASLATHGIAVIDRPVAALTGGDSVESIRFADDRDRACSAVFFVSRCVQRSPLPERLGCRVDEEFSVKCDHHAATGVPGLYIAGNVRGGLHFAVTAAAEGAEAAVAMNQELLARAARKLRMKVRA